MGDKIKLTPTKLNADGTGYYRGTDGRQYYGHQQNGYVVETEQSRRARAQGQSAAPSQSRSYGGGYAAGGAECGIVEWLAAGVGSAIMTAGMIATFFIALIISITMAWPWYIDNLAKHYREGRADLMVIIMSAVVAFLIIYFLLSVYKVFQTQRMRSRRFVVVCIVSMTIPAIPVGLLMGSPSIISSFAFNGIFMSILPAFILCFFEHLATKEIRGDKEWFITKIARLINRIFPGHSTGMTILGVLVLLFDILVAFTFSVVDIPDKSGVPGPMTFFIVGMLLIIGARVTKKKEGR